MPRVNKVKQICKECGKPFESWIKQSTCSRECGMKFRSREYKKGRVVKCNWCEKLFYRMPSKIKRYNFCNPDHQHKFNKQDPNMSKGWHHTEEARERIAEANRNKDYKANLTAEGREALRKSALENLQNKEVQKKSAKTRMGMKFSEEHKRRIKENAKYGRDNALWKGNKASYQAKHMWIYVRNGQPNECSDCGITSDERKIEWSNVDHKYRRNLDDYVGRCVPCHRRYDIKNGYRAFGRKAV